MYVLIEAGVVVDGPRRLPAIWRNVSGLDGLSTEELAPFGWFPVDDPPAYDPAWQEAPTAAVEIAGGDGAWIASVEWETVPRAIEAVRDEALAAVRAEARRRILAIAPEHRQANLTARAAEIVAELTAGRAVWLAINAIRAASDVGEAAVMSAETAEAAAAVPASVEWPT